MYIFPSSAILIALVVSLHRARHNSVTQPIFAPRKHFLLEAPYKKINLRTLLFFLSSYAVVFEEKKFSSCDNRRSSKKKGKMFCQKNQFSPWWIVWRNWRCLRLLPLNTLLLLSESTHSYTHTKPSIKCVLQSPVYIVDSLMWSRNFWAVCPFFLSFSCLFCLTCKLAQSV